MSNDAPTAHDLVASARHLAAERASNDQFRVLDPYAPDGITAVETRLDALATISAGFRGKGQEGHAGRPQRSTDSTIYVHGLPERSRGLREALKRNGGKSLTIAFPFDQLSAFIQQRYVLYSSTRLEAYGDQDGITYIQVKGEAKDAVVTRHFYAAGTEGFTRLLGRVKNSVSVYFVLAEWTDRGARIIMPDGAGLFRLRFTSRNSLRNLIADIRYVQQFTHGRIAGVPFELSIDYREVSGPDGSKRTVPVWCAVSRPPGGITLSSENWRGLISRSLQQGAALMLPEPSPETIELAEAEGSADDLDELDITPVVDAPTQEQLARGALCDATYWKRRWGAIVDGTALDSDEARQRFVQAHSGYTESLATFLTAATDIQAHELIEAAIGQIHQRQIQALHDAALGRTALPPPGERPGAGFGGRPLAEIGYDDDPDETAVSVADSDAPEAVQTAPDGQELAPNAEDDDELDDWFTAIKSETTLTALRRLKPQIVALKGSIAPDAYERLALAWTAREGEIKASVPASP